VWEFVINDFPNQVRFTLTKRQTLEPVIDESGATIIQRGQFVVPGERVPVGERKLALVVEGATKFVVQVAKQALEAIVAADMSKREIARPLKYKVV
jgi:hypothetical protein